MTIKPKAPRWYSWRDGQITPCYELPKKNGNGMKNYTLREARELKLLPSVTTVLSVIDKPELDNWRVMQAIQAALTLPSMGEGLDEYAKRILADAEAQSNNAAEFGTRIHNAIAEYMKTRLMPRYEAQMTGEEYNFIQPFIVWADENIEEVHAVEQVVGHPSVGVAGRMDLDCTLKGVGRTVIDIKSQAIRDGKPTFWKEWPVQLAAYANCCERQDLLVRRLCSVVIQSNEPGPVWPQVWPETQDYWHVFQAALRIWIYSKGNGYDPRQLLPEVPF